MTLKTRAELKAENAGDFPNNNTRLISPADLRGQMDDVADSALLREDIPGLNVSEAVVTATDDGTKTLAEWTRDIVNGGIGTPGSGIVIHIAQSIAEMRALPDLTVGSIIYVGPRADQFVVVDDPLLSTDGGTVFIPDSELSELYEEAIPPATFAGATGANVAMEYDLAHTGIDFESVELVLTDGGETIDIWNLHGHVYLTGSAERVDCPQLPLIDTGRGKFRDPGAYMTGTKPASHPAIRTGGALLRYKYATSGLRLKRIIGPVFLLRWWPVVAVDDELPGEQTDNSGRICWCMNAAAAAKAEAVLVERMYYYQRCVEIPDGVELRGLGPGISGFRVMDNGQFKEMLLTTSSDGAAADQSLNPLAKPATRLWSYDSSTYSQATTFLHATGAMRIRISGIEFDGNMDNNLRLFSETDNTGHNTEYAYKYANQSVHLFNTVASAAFVYGNAGGRIVTRGSVCHLHNVKMHGYSHLVVGNLNVVFYGTGLLELGNVITGHWSYFADGFFENIRCTGHTTSDGLRQHYLVAKSVEYILAPHPLAMFEMPATFSGPPPFGNQYAPRTMRLIGFNEIPQTQVYQTITSGGDQGWPYPQLPPSRILIENFFVDATGLDDWPQAYAYEPAIPFVVGGDNFHIKSGRIRFGSFVSGASILVDTNINSAGYAPFKNQLFENLSVEYASRKGVQLQSAGVVDPGAAQLNYRNITFEPRAATHIPGDPGPSGVSVLLGSWRFYEFVPPEPSGSPLVYSIYDGREFEFSAVTVDATLNGKYIDITPPDPVAPTYRFWFDYGSPGPGIPPAAGGATLVEVNVPAGATTAATAAAFSNAIAGTIASPAVPAPYLTAATYGTKSVVGALSHYRSQVKGGYVGTDVTNAVGVTTALRAHRRNYEPSVINFENFIAADPTYIGLLLLSEIGEHRDIYFNFKDCVFGAWLASGITLNGTGSFASAPVLAIMDQVHCDFQDTTFDMRDSLASWSTLDLHFYASKYRNCRIRTPNSITGVSALGAGYEVLLSEESGVSTVTTLGGETFIDIQTKLFWVPKEGQTRLYPADAAAAVVWNGPNIPSVEWRRSARPIGGATIALGGGGSYYQGTAGINEDRRAPVLRLNFGVPLPATTMKIGWSAAVSP
jgi:hypothetical protein